MFCRALILAAADVQPLSFNWAFNKWLVFLSIILAGALVYCLYRAQQHIASRRIVNALTAIRLILIVLMFVLLAGPVFQRRHTSEQNGTLWLLVDQSLSMDQTDKQMTPAERLHWADSLGWLPEHARPGKLHRQIAELGAMRADLAFLESRAQLPASDAQAMQQQTVLYEQIKTLWRQIDPSKPAPDSLKSLDAAITALKPISEQADAKFLKDNQANPKVQEALAKVTAQKRADLAIAAITQKLERADAALLDSLPKHTIRLVGFSDTPVPLASSDPRAVREAVKTNLKPAGHSTDLSGTLAWLNEQIGPDEQASIVIVSDGRHNRSRRPDLVEPSRVLSARGVRLFTVGIGSEAVAPDASVEQIDAPDWIYKDDTLRAAAMLRIDGMAGKTLTVEFRRAGVKEPVKTESFTPSTQQAVRLVRFEDRPKDAGALEYEIAIKPLPEETLDTNNTQRFRVTARKDRLSALIIEERPRWEYRYLANYLERDQRVKLQKVLFQPAPVADIERPAPVMASPKNESPEAQRLPDTPEKWAAFDLIVIGDIPPSRLSEDQQRALAKAVNERGAALIFIAGNTNLPSRYSSAEAKALSDLLPIELASPWSAAELSDTLKAGFHPALAPDGALSVLSQFSPDEIQSAQQWSNLPPWYWHSAQTRAKLAASVIWTIPPSGAKPLPLSEVRQRALLATMPSGLGRSMYLASDSTWRLRQVAGDNLHERFWGQVMRWAVGNDLPGGGKLVKFGSDKPRYIVGDSVTITARLLDPRTLAPLSVKDIKAVAKNSTNKRLSETPLAEVSAGSGVYRTTINSLPAGRIDLSLIGKEIEENLASDPAVVTKSLAVDILPYRDDESQNINTDFPALARIADAGGGVMVRGPNADILSSHLPSLMFTSENIEQAGLFSNPMHRGTKLIHWTFLIAFVTLLTAEWVIRKAGGLV